MSNYRQPDPPLRSSVVAAALMLLLYVASPALRSLSFLRLTGCYLGVMAIVAILRWWFRPRRRASSFEAAVAELLGELEAMAPAKAASSPRGSGLLRWYGKGATVKVGAYTLNDPLVYVLGGPGFVDEVSCIDPQLTIGKPLAGRSKSLGFFPEYAQLSPDQRATYLRWLQRGRSGPLADVGYALLFFYGLERRLILDGKDLDDLIEEAVRLLKAYPTPGPGPGPLDEVLGRFLPYALARAGIATLEAARAGAVFGRDLGYHDEQYLAVGLAWLCNRRRPLPASWALRIAALDPAAPRGVVLERIPAQFVTLFGKRYRERHGDGLLLKASKRDREVTYLPSSPSLSDNHGPPARVPHVLGLPSQFSTLIEIWTSCIEDLKPLSRAMAKAGGLGTRAAYDAMPDELKGEVEPPDKAAWDRLAAENAVEDGTALVEVGTLAALREIAPRPRLTARQGESLAEAAHAFGYVIEPDARVTRRPYGWGELVALFRPEGPPRLPSDARYPGAAAMLEVGMFVAAADGQVVAEEVDHIAEFLEAQWVLDPPDARRLEALRRVFLKQPPSIAGIGKRLKAILNAEQIASVGEFLVGVAAANGPIEKAEVSALRAAYKALGLDVGRLDGLIEENRRQAKEPIDVLPTTESPDSGEAIPPRPSPGPRPAFRLDAALIERLMHETRQVASLLDDAMSDDEPPSEPPVKAPPLPAPSPAPSAAIGDPRFEGLPPRYHPVLAELCTRPSWDRADFETLVRKHSLMPSGTEDVINEWAQERFDDPILVEREGHLVVSADLIADLPHVAPGISREAS